MIMACRPVVAVDLQGWPCLESVEYSAKALSNPKEAKASLVEMATVKRELMMLRVFRLTLPAALLISLTWMTLFTDSARQAVLNSLGANANIIVFILGLFVVVGLYWLMGVYERKILYENRHVRPAF